MAQRKRALDQEAQEPDKAAPTGTHYIKVEDLGQNDDAEELDDQFLLGSNEQANCHQQDVDDEVYDEYSS